MTRLLIIKEWRHTLSSPKFWAASSMVTVLILLAIFLGAQEYRAFVGAQDGARSLLAEDQSQATSWTMFRHRVFRPADTLQVFAAGMHRDLGRHAVIHGSVEPELHRSLYGDEPIFALFRSFDLAFVIIAVLSLFAVVFTYDAVCGERERGTLRLMMAGAVPRSAFIGAKAFGLWTALLLPVALAGLLGVTLLPILGVPLSLDDGARIAVLGLAGFLYLTVFAFLGVAISAWNRTASSSFLWLLAVWVVVVLVLPRAGLVVATHWVPVPSAAELDSERRGFEDRMRQESFQALQERILQRSREQQALDEDQRQAYEDENMWSWIEEDERAREETETKIQHHADRLRESTAALKARQRHLALSLSRVSPAATFQLAATAIADTGVGWLDRWQPTVDAYRDEWLTWIRANGGDSQHVIRRSGDSGSPFGNSHQTLDLSTMPRFVASRPSLAELFSDLPVDLGSLAIQALLALSLAFFGMQRYDVR